jgi:uncharacterized SAM-binding protein YcdF (DUF218 family)
MSSERFGWAFVWRDRIVAGSREALRRWRPSALELIVAGGFLMGFAAYALAIVLAEPLLAVRTGHPVQADVIVMLGGDGPSRAAETIRQYRAGIAPRVLISGDGDCVDMKPMLLGGGVPEDAILSECESGTTWENATLSAPILAELGVTRAVLVTSGFHMRRALSCFRMSNPEVEWSTVPVKRYRSYTFLIFNVEGTRVAREYVKLLWYAARYRISVLPNAGPDVALRS